MEILWWILTHNVCTQVPTIDPIHMRIVGHALRMIDSFLGPGDTLRIALWVKKLKYFSYT